MNWTLTGSEMQAWNVLSSSLPELNSCAPSPLGSTKWHLNTVRQPRSYFSMPSHFRIWTSPLPPWGAQGLTGYLADGGSTSVHAGFQRSQMCPRPRSSCDPVVESNCLGFPVLARKAPRSRTPSVPSRPGWLSILPRELVHALINLQDSRDFSRLPVVLPPSWVLAGQREGSRLLALPRARVSGALETAPGHLPPTAPWASASAGQAACKHGLQTPGGTLSALRLSGFGLSCCKPGS